MLKFLTKAKFTGFVTKYMVENKLDALAAIIRVCEDTEVDFVSVMKYMEPSLLAKLEEQCVREHKIKSVGSFWTEK